MFRDKVKPFIENERIDRDEIKTPDGQVLTVYYRNMSEGLLRRLISSAEDETHGDGLLIRQCVVTAEGHREYSDTADDLEEILSMDSYLSTQLSDGILRHIKPASVKELAKNSETTPDGSMQSDSQDNVA